MIQAKQLLADLTRQLKRLEDDLRQRMEEVPELKASLQSEWQAARDANRNAETFEGWADQVITQAGVHWLLSCVFIRFIEDNGLVERPWLAGTPNSGRLALARDRHEAYFRANPRESDREFLLAAFRDSGSLPGLQTFFDESHNPVFRLGISGDAAMALRQFWQQVDPNTGLLAHDFIDPDWNTRFLGDLYQDLSEATRKRYALLQTPEFVEEFILDRTLTPAIREFGFREVRMIDPTCGSGHFLLGGFYRVVAEWSRNEPTRNRRDVAQKALDAIAGVDLNPFAVAIARFRLLVAALKVSDVHRLSEAPDFKIHVAIGDSLLHGQRFGLSGQSGIQSDEMFDVGQSHADSGLAHAYASEDLAQVQQILGRQYHAVVGNPPYIVVKDAALNAAYRAKYASCHRQYSLGVPFTERFFELTVTGRTGEKGAVSSAGFIGLITADSFMKREFGSRLIEQVLPRLDLTHVVHTSGAYIPGHGTPTVILFGRHRPPISPKDFIRTVMGIKGEPTTPDEPARGLVWSAIMNQIDIAGSESEFVSVVDTERAVFYKHPWSVGGGGAADLKDILDEAGTPLSNLTTDLGFICITKADDVFVIPKTVASRKRLDVQGVRPFGVGEDVRDWNISSHNYCIFPYSNDAELLPEKDLSSTLKFIWRCRIPMLDRKVFGGKTYAQAGKIWYSYGQIPVERFKITKSIVFAFVSTHNHFVFDIGGKVYKQTAPVIKLSAGASEDDHIGLIGLLNSSSACFWMKQVFQNKGNGGISGGIAAEPWERCFEFASTGLNDIPLVDNRPLDIAKRLDSLARQLEAVQPEARLATVGENLVLPTRASLDEARVNATRLQRLMIATQEELDWRCYELYSLLRTSDQGYSPFSYPNPPEIALGERAFEIVMARRMTAGTETTTWFERHGSTPITAIPSHWPEDYRQVVQRRIDLIESDRNIGLIERPEYKRRWNTPQWQVQEQAALRDWLLARLESPVYWPTSADQPPQLTSTSRLADAAQRDADFMHTAALYAGHADFDLSQLVATLVTGEAAPFLPVLRYTEAGLRKRDQWEATWALQRREDAGEDVGSIPVPPKYKSTDFLKAPVWQLRGGLDVPKERWISYPGCERGADGSLPIAWAGWDHLQQATALAGYYLDMKDNEGWDAARLQPLLAGLLDLVPWLEQWHNDINPVYGERMGHYYKGFVTEEARSHGFTLDDLRAWKPVVTAAVRGRRRVAAA